MSLAVPLLPSQIEAAGQLYGQLQLWQATDSAFKRLREALPGFDIQASLLKAAAINQLYGTNVYAIVRMAQHITTVMAAQGNTPPDAALVEQIANLPNDNVGGKNWRHISFASKFAHFFIDKHLPIYDRYAAMMLNYHRRGRAVVPDPAPPYATYLANLDMLRDQAGISCSPNELDAYLWLAGLYIEWRKPRADGKQAEINREVRELFERGDEVGVKLDSLLPISS